MWTPPAKVSVDIPDGTSGRWSVYTFKVTKEDEERERFRAAIHGSRRYVPAGTYKGLKNSVHLGTVMSNTPDELRDHREFFREACGKVLINGLGLGVALKVILEKTNEDGSYAVDHVTVVELSEDVIKLVGPYFQKKYPNRVTIIQADALKYKPTGTYDVCWHDIWTDICTDNLKDMHKLHRKYGRKCAWQGSWCRELCEYRKSRGR